MACLTQVAQEFTGLRPDADIVYSAFSRSTEIALRTLGIDDAILPAALKRYDTLCFTAGKVFPFPGILQLLDELKSRGMPMAIYSARHRYEFFCDPAARPLLPYFQEIISADHFPPKPDPAGVLAYIRTHHLQPEDILFVGDTAVDCSAAAAAGVDMALALWNPLTNQHQKELRAAYVCETPGDIPKILSGDRGSLHT